MNLTRITEICKRECELNPDRPVLAAFSGGPDSLSLLILLRDIGYPVIAAHFNHHLRKEADQDEQAARALAIDLGIKFIAGRGDVPAFIREQKLSVEEGARQLRYEWLTSLASELGAQAIAVGHTADDQVETVIMHLIRGSGLDGLTGMPYRQEFNPWGAKIPIVRPLLDSWREETEEICRQSGLVPVQDESNSSTLYFRNQIRLELVPFMQKYNNQLKSHIFQTTKILTEEQSILNMVKQEAWINCLPEYGKSWVSLDADMLQSLQAGLQRSVLRKAVLECKPDLRDIDFALTIRMCDFVENPTRTGEMHLIDDLWIQHAQVRFFFWKGRPGLTAQFPQLETDIELQLTIPDHLHLDGWTIDTVEIPPVENPTQPHTEELCPQVFLDYDRLEFPLVLRTQVPGERIQPLGMKGRRQKLSDYFGNKKIPRQARPNWPLLVSGNDVVWVIGLGISEKAAVSKETRRVAKISLQFPALPPGG